MWIRIDFVSGSTKFDETGAGSSSIEISSHQEIVGDDSLIQFFPQVSIWINITVSFASASARQNWSNGLYLLILGA